jgi:hypothetical protein
MRGAAADQTGDNQRRQAGRRLVVLCAVGAPK